MKEEDLSKAIELKKELDYERGLLLFANNRNVKLKITLEDNCDHGRKHDVGYIFGDGFIENMKAVIITIIEKSVNNLLDKLEKL